MNGKLYILTSYSFFWFSKARHVRGLIIFILGHRRACSFFAVDVPMGSLKGTSLIIFKNNNISTQQNLMGLVGRLDTLYIYIIH